MPYMLPLSGSFFILTPGFPANEQDTTCLPPIQQYVLATLNLYPDIRITIITFQYPFQKSAYTWHGARVIALGGSNKPGINRLMTWLSAWKTLTKLRKEHPPTGLLSLWLTECALVGKFFSRVYRLKHFMWIQGQDVKKTNRYIRRISPAPTEVIAISEFTQREMNKNFGIKPAFVIENGINPSVFPSLNTGARQIDILAVGSLIHLKRYDRIIEIVRVLKMDFPGLKAGIAGQGVNEHEIRALCREAGLEDTIEFYGSVPHNQVLKLMNNSRIFLHTSDYEGNSTVLIEALYSGCTVFSTQELSSKKLSSFHLMQTNEDFVAGISESLRTEKIPARILFNDMAATARRIMQLFERS